MGGIMKEEEEEAMMKNKNLGTPTITSDESHLIKGDATAIASTPQKRRNTYTSIVVGGVDECDKEISEAKPEENTGEEGQGEGRSMSPSSRLKEESGRERLKRHRVEVAGQIWIPDTWGQEHLLNDWIDSSGFDSAFAHKEMVSARTALAEEARRPLSVSGRLGVENSC